MDMLNKDSSQNHMKKGKTKDMCDKISKSTANKKILVEYQKTINY